MAPSRTIALVPARAGSKGIPGKNFRELGGAELWEHAAVCAVRAGCDPVYISTDARYLRREVTGCQYLNRPARFAQDDTPMFDVVQHAAETLQLADDDVIVLLQPTAPLRTPERVKEAIALLRESGADSVVSVVELPLTHSPVRVCAVDEDGRLESWGSCHLCAADWHKRRQDMKPAYVRDGTVYAFYVRNLYRAWRTNDEGERWRPTREHFYGDNSFALIIPPDETCELDTEDHWRELERRWKERHATAQPPRS